MKVFLTNLPPIPQELSPLSLSSGMPPLGLGFLAAHLERAGHEVFVHDNVIEYNTFRENLKAFDPDFIGISVLSIFYVQLEPLIEEIRKITDAKLFCGGPHATLMPETIPEKIAHIICGEGEYALLDIIEGREDRRVIHAERISDLDELEFPDMKWFADKGYQWNFPQYGLTGKTFSMNTSRGCPFVCAFCSVKSIWGKEYRVFSAEKVVAYIEDLVGNHGIKSIFFREDNFTAHKDRVIKIFLLLKEKKISITWACETRVDSLDEEYLDFMCEHGLRGAFFGVESGSQDVLDASNKGITVEKSKQVFAYCKKIGIKTYASMMYGFPGETEADRQKSDMLLAEITPDMHSKAVFIGIPKSSIYDQIKESGDYYYMDKNFFIYPTGYYEHCRRYYTNVCYSRYVPSPIRQQMRCSDDVVSILVISYERKQKLVRCIQSVLDTTPSPYEILVLDNGSQDHELLNYLKVLERLEDAVTVFYGEKNIGCGPGRKYLTERASGNYIVTLDNDIEVSAGWLDPLIAELKKENVVGVAPMLVEQPASIIRGVGVQKSKDSAGQTIMRGVYAGLSLSEMEHIKTLPPVDVDLLYGGAMLFRQSVLAKAAYGSNFYSGYNDYNFCNQLKELGILRGVPASVLYHNPEKNALAAGSMRSSHNYVEIARSVHDFYERWQENLVKHSNVGQYILGYQAQTQEDWDTLQTCLIEAFDEKRITEVIIRHIDQSKIRSWADAFLSAMIGLFEQMKIHRNAYDAKACIDFIRKQQHLFSNRLLYNYASFLEDNADYDEAHELFKAILSEPRKAPNTLRGRVFYHLACIQKKQNMRSEAVAYVKQCLMFEPGHGKAQELLHDLII